MGFRYILCVLFVNLQTPQQKPMRTNIIVKEICALCVAVDLNVALRQFVRQIAEKKEEETTTVGILVENIAGWMLLDRSFDRVRAKS